jgi:hypothetical protein
MTQYVRVKCFNKTTNLPGATQYFRQNFRQNEEAHHRFAMMRLLRQQTMFFTLL